jgi:hypothetical protein
LGSALETGEPILNVVGLLTLAELDDAHLGEVSEAKRILSLFPTARMIPPSRGTLRPETRKCPEA